MAETMTPETYLGDGLYASFDGWQILLRAPREDGDHWVALEPATYAALLQFARQIPKLMQQQNGVADDDRPRKV